MDKPVSQAEQAKPAKKKSAIVKLSILGVLLIIGLIFAFCPMQFGMTKYTPFISSIKLGLDLEGGVYAVYEAENTNTEDFDSKMNGTRSSLERLIVSKGYAEATVVREGTDRIRVEVPDVDDPSSLLNIIGEPAELRFELDSSKEVVLTGENVIAASGGWDQSSGYVVSLTLDSEGTTNFANATTNNIGSTMSIILTIGGEDQTISSPSIESAITTGRAIITGFSSQTEAQQIADQIMSGTFDVSLTLRETQTISATLGENALKYGIIAGVIGFFLIIIFLCIFYRMLGVAASISLLAYLVLYFFFLAALPWVQLTLPGIAGVLLSIGMAVDANVIIYERMKDEYRNGKSLIASYGGGFKKATVAIIDSNVTTIIAAILLYALGTGSIKGFALTLLVGIVVSLITSLLITRFITGSLVQLNNTNEKMYSLKRGKGFEALMPDVTDPEVAERLRVEQEEREKAKKKRKEKRERKNKVVEEVDSLVEQARREKSQNKNNNGETEDSTPLDTDISETTDDSSSETLATDSDTELNPDKILQSIENANNIDDVIENENSFEDDDVNTDGEEK